MRRALTAAVLLTLALPGAASAHPKPKPKTVHCKSGYARKARKVKEHRHGKTIHVRVQVCVKRKASKPAVKGLATPPSASATVPLKRTVKLHAHLDPTLARDPTNPFQVTYSYSASATTETLTDGAALDAPAEPAPLPDGVLTLYNEGLLACSINVGAETTGGECPITYSSLGDHTVTTIYTAGEGSATETETEDIEPFATTTTVSARYEQLPVSEAEAVERHVEQILACGGCGPRSRTITTHTIWAVGYITVEGEASDAFGALSVRVEDNSSFFAAPHTFPVHASEEEIAQETCATRVIEGTGIVDVCEPWGTPTYTTYAPPQEALVQAQDVAGSGFVPSEASTTITFDAHLVYPEGDEP